MGCGQLGKHLKCFVVSFLLPHGHSKKSIWAQKIEKWSKKWANEIAMIFLPNIVCMIFLLLYPNLSSIKSQLSEAKYKS